jgi:hypothetical protein
MKILSALTICLAVLADGAATTQNDTDLSASLIGTWTDPPSERTPMHGRGTYDADGHGVELVWQAGQPESTAVRIETRWEVTNQILVTSSVKSSDVQRVPVGITLHDRIVSISSDQFVFEPEGYAGKEKEQHTRIRVKPGQTTAPATAP